MNCPNCGKQISDTAKVCGYCGHTLSPKAAKPSPAKAAARPVAQRKPASAPVPGKTRIPNWVWAVVGILVIAFVIWLVTPAISGNSQVSGNSFAGKWVAEDLDGSSMNMEIRQSSNGVYTLERYDDMSNACAGTTSGKGEGYEESPYMIVVTVSFKCAGGSELGSYTIAYRYDPSTDTVREETPDPSVFIYWERMD